MATATDYQVEVRNLTNDEYHADRSAIGKSGIWTFRNRRRLFEAEYVLGTAPARDPSKVMDIGTLADAGLLEPHRLHELYVVYPESVLSKSGTTNTNAARDFEDENPGKICIRQKHFETVSAMVESVKAKFGDWLKLPSERQQSIFWTEPESGIRCKCRPDWRILRSSDGIVRVFDLKTTGDASPRAFARRCEEMGYAIQDAHYSEGVFALTERDVEFYFAVVETDFPFACNIQQVKPDDRERARSLRRQLLRELRDCRESGDYSESWESEIISINLRPFCFER